MYLIFRHILSNYIAVDLESLLLQFLLQHLLLCGSATTKFLAFDYYFFIKILIRVYSTSGFLLISLLCKTNLQIFTLYFVLS